MATRDLFASVAVPAPAARPAAPPKPVATTKANGAFVCAVPGCAADAHFGFGCFRENPAEASVWTCAAHRCLGEGRSRA